MAELGQMQEAMLRAGLASKEQAESSAQAVDPVIGGLLELQELDNRLPKELRSGGLNVFLIISYLRCGDTTSAVKVIRGIRDEKLRQLAEIENSKSRS